VRGPSLKKSSSAALVTGAQLCDQNAVGLVDAQLLAQLLPGASFINFARGAIVNDTDLLQALDQNHLSHAVLDVFTLEPLPESAWQWEHPQVTVLPHRSAPTDRDTASLIVADNIQRYRATWILEFSISKTQFNSKEGSYGTTRIHAKM
jgi:phosphoglycerate dehydrogenase-like enzyme